MAAKLRVVRRTLTILLWLLPTLVLQGKTAQPAAAGLTTARAQSLVERALGAELRSLQGQGRPMRFLLHKASPRLSTTKEIIETRDGAVARLLRVNGRPLSEAEEQAEKERLDALWSDPDRQRHRKQGQDQDTERALKVLRALPEAFVYQFAGVAQEPGGEVAKFTFRPNRNFNPQDLETQVLTAMTGYIWIDMRAKRVTRLEGRLERDVSFGWGILGRLDKGGVDCDGAGGRGRGRVARGAVQDGDERPGSVQEQGFRYGADREPVCTRAGGFELPAGDRDAASGAGGNAGP